VNEAETRAELIDPAFMSDMDKMAISCPISVSICRTF